MTSAILTRWPVTREIGVAAGDVGEDGCARREALERWFGLVWEDYLRRCPKLGDLLGLGATRLSMGALRMSSRLAVQEGETLRAAIATTELWPTAFEIALRVRALTREAGPVANGRRSVSLVCVSDGSRAVIPCDTRTELIGLESNAIEYC